MNQSSRPGGPNDEPRIVLTPEQANALEQILQWWRRTGPFGHFTLGGYAGTGKTTIISELEHALPGVMIAYCALAGKAVQVLRNKLRENGVELHRWTLVAGVDAVVDKATTIHSLLYRPTELEMCGCGECATALVGHEVCPRPLLGPSGRPRVEVVWGRAEVLKGVDLIVIDEASMVNQEIWEDLCSLGIPILAVGDHGQLPPIGGHFSLMDHPDVRLEKIHRQAEGNPILRVSQIVRETGYLPVGEYVGENGQIVVKTSSPSSIDVEMDTLVICGRNDTRVALNRGFRAAHGFTAPGPVLGDRVICLRNHRGFRIFNGMRGTVLDVDARFTESGTISELVAELTIRMDDREDPEDLFTGPIWLPQFGAPRTTDERVDGTLWDFAYAITCHKAQGSEADHVIVYEDGWGRTEDERRRWLYTAITRATERLLVIGQ